LLGYMAREGHVSPFEMCNLCIEVNTTRAIGRQLLRHRSFSFQEFSQRYAEVEEPLTDVECRMQDTKNRQNSLGCYDQALADWWKQSVEQHNFNSSKLYTEALNQGIAKEVARSVLPEGTTASRLYVNGNIRSWIFYLKSRLHPSTQWEHRMLAENIAEIFAEQAPVTFKAFF
jgi:thymidylate synthase (FAD)